MPAGANASSSRITIRATPAAGKRELRERPVVELPVLQDQVGLRVVGLLKKTTILPTSAACGGPPPVITWPERPVIDSVADPSGLNVMCSTRTTRACLFLRTHPDLDCADSRAMGLAPVRSVGSDRHRFDGDGDGDGWGCE